MAMNDMHLTYDTCKKMCLTGPKPKVVHVPGVGHTPFLFTDLEIDAITQFVKECRVCTVFSCN